MPKKDWKTELKKLATTKGFDTLRMELTPYRDWRVLVVIFFITLAVSIGFNVYMSVGINRDSFFATAPRPAGVVKFNEEGLAKVVLDINEKTARFEEIKTRKIIFVDPSL